MEKQKEQDDGNMRRVANAAATEGLIFFGQISASISHELKNTLSIMNENAGLLADLTAMAERGKPIDSARAKRLSDAIQKQIKRTDEIIRNMNRFSHLVDEPFRQIELTDFIRLVIAITHRLAVSAGARVEITPPETPLYIVTKPFFLHHLLWLLIRDCILSHAPDNDLTLSPRPADPGVHIVFSGFTALSYSSEKKMAEQPEKNLMILLGATLSNGGENTLILFLPETADH